MQRVIVTVLPSEEAPGLDLELPAGQPVSLLLPQIARALELPEGSYRLESCPGGRPLAAEETLARAGIWDGAWLMLRPL